MKYLSSCRSSINITICIVTITVEVHFRFRSSSTFNTISFNSVVCLSLPPVYSCHLLFSNPGIDFHLAEFILAFLITYYRVFFNSQSFLWPFLKKLFWECHESSSIWQLYFKMNFIENTKILFASSLESTVTYVFYVSF